MAYFIGTFALTSLISANAVERLVPSVSTNVTTNNNSGVLGLSEFEMQRIGVAAAVSFLGGIIQVGGEHIFCTLLMCCICDSYDFCTTFCFFTSLRKTDHGSGPIFMNSEINAFREFAAPLLRCSNCLYTCSWGVAI